MGHAHPYIENSIAKRPKRGILLYERYIIGWFIQIVGNFGQKRRKIKRLVHILLVSALPKKRLFKPVKQYLTEFGFAELEDS